MKLPPLPRHPKKGISVNAGEKFVIRDFSITIKDGNEIRNVEQPSLLMRVPPWNAGYQCGATFSLQWPLENRTINVDGHRVDICDDRETIEVGLKDKVENPVHKTALIANRVLDILATENFQISALNDPLRQHSIWIRKGSETILKAVTTVKLAVSVSMNAEVLDSKGAVKNQGKQPTLRWHASHAYFRISQITNNLHEAYRNLFLALESLLSEVYPQNGQLGERAWLEASLKHVIEGYDLDLSLYVGGTGGNPYKRFSKEQYRARRCALFHAKVGKNPTIPGDLASRDELIVATRRLGRLYVQLSQLITGSNFGGGQMSNTAFKNMIKSQAESPLYVSEDKDFNLDNCILSDAELELNAYGQIGLHLLRGRWSSADLPQHLNRIGLLVHQENELIDGIYESVNIDITNASELVVVLQNEMVNSQNLREWFL